MQYLLDTHILIWFLTKSPKLHANVLEIMMEEQNEFFVSTESIREMIVKSKMGKLTLPADMDELLFELQEKQGIHLLTIEPKHLKQLYALEILPHHKDPFDHLLICQAIAEQMTLISADRNFPFYRSQGLRLIENFV